MTLALTDFDPIVDTLTNNAGVIVGVITAVAGIKAVFSLVRRYTRV